MVTAIYTSWGYNHSKKWKREKKIERARCRIWERAGEINAQHGDTWNSWQTAISATLISGKNLKCDSLTKLLELNSDQFIGFIHYFSNFNRVKISKKKESKMGSKATSKLSPTCAGDSWWLRKHQVIKWCRSGLFSRRNWNWSHLWAWGWVHNEVNCSSLGGNRTLKSVPCQRAMIDTFAFTGTWWPMPWPI